MAAGRISWHWKERVKAPMRKMQVGETIEL
jgi:hypothetical protein